jgi:neutral ceramidase
MIKAGFGQADITAEVGCSRTGSYRNRVMTGVHDPLLAVACVVDDGTTPVALVGIDAGVIMRATADSAKKLIAEQTGIPPANVIISASHTHQGGPTLSTFHAQADPAYADVVARGAASAVKQAWENRRDARVASDFGRVTGIHFNRRFLMRDGREVTHPGKKNPDIVRPAGEVDEKIGVIAIRDSADRIVGLIVNFGCHCTVTEDGTEYSADYVHYLRQHVQRSLEAEVPVVFLLGACGDVTQINNQKPEWEKGHAWADLMGATLASEVARILRQMKWHARAETRAAGRSVPIAIREHDACPPATVGLGSGDDWAAIFQREKEPVAAMRAQRPIVDCQVSGVRIGDVAIVANGGELFTQPALNIQRASPIEKTWVVTLANEYVGYVPTATAHFAGGYEVRLARSSYLEVAAAQKLVETSLSVLCDLNS